MAKAWYLHELIGFILTISQVQVLNQMMMPAAKGNYLHSAFTCYLSEMALKSNDTSN